MITVSNPDNEGIYTIDCDTGITLDNVKALLEADVSDRAVPTQTHTHSTLASMNIHTKKTPSLSPPP